MRINRLCLSFSKLRSANVRSNRSVCVRCLATAAAQSAPPNQPAAVGSAGPSLLVSAVSSAPSNVNLDSINPLSLRNDPDHQLSGTAKVNFFLEKPLPHKIPDKYLRHCTSDLLTPEEKAQRDRLVPHNKIVGVVVSYKAQKTAKVRVTRQKWDKRIKKYFSVDREFLVHDPRESLRTGDVVELLRFAVTSNVRHVVASIISPNGSPIESRPPIPTPEELLAAYKEARFAKLKRRAARKKSQQGGAATYADSTGKSRLIAADRQSSIDQKHDSSEQPRALSGRAAQRASRDVSSEENGEAGIGKTRAQSAKVRARRLEGRAMENLAEADQKEEENKRVSGISSAVS